MVCGKAEPVACSVDTVEFGSLASASASASSSPVLQARNKIDSRAGCVTVIGNSITITTASSTPNFDQSSLGSDDSGICCSSTSGNQLRLARSSEYFEDDDVMMQFEESKSLEEEMEPSTVDTHHPISKFSSVQDCVETVSTVCNDRYIRIAVVLNTIGASITQLIIKNLTIYFVFSELVQELLQMRLVLAQARVMRLVQHLNSRGYYAGSNRSSLTCPMLSRICSIRKNLACRRT